MRPILQHYEVGTKQWWRAYASSKLGGMGLAERYVASPSCVSFFFVICCHRGPLFVDVDVDDDVHFAERIA